ncbi:MAG: hypothetical protein WAV05_16930 [Anaerolineales bacterium]
MAAILVEDINSLMVDGNAPTGPLYELFAVEMTNTLSSVEPVDVKVRLVALGIYGRPGFRATLPGLLECCSADDCHS